jgi:hypothetical protein
MVAWHGCRRIGRDKLETSGRGTMGAGCACGTRRAASNPSKQGVLWGRGELSGRMSVATGRVRMWGGNKNQYQRTGVDSAGVLSGRPGASIACWDRLGDFGY